MKPLPLPKLSDHQITLFWSHVDIRGPEECWPWKGATSSRKYSCLRYAIWNFREPGFHRILRPHRVAYSLLVAPIPDGMTIDHLCRNTLCTNPGHLRVVTLQENIAGRGDTTPHKYRPTPAGVLTP